jgi:hypothetical protein
MLHLIRYKVFPKEWCACETVYKSAELDFYVWDCKLHKYVVCHFSDGQPLYNWIVINL